MRSPSPSNRQKAPFLAPISGSAQEVVKRGFLVLFGLFIVAGSLRSQEWIWGPAGAENDRPANETVYLGHIFTLPAKVTAAEGAATADNHFELSVNGTLIASGDNWSQPTPIDGKNALQSGRNQIVVKAWNDGGPAGFALQLRIKCEDGSRHVIRTGQRWKALAPPSGPWVSAEIPGDSRPVSVLGRMGRAPWGPLSLEPAGRMIPVDGFAVSEVAAGLGSIVTLARFGDRLLAGIEGGPIRVLSDDNGDGTYESASVFSEAVRDTQGLCVMGADVFAVGQGKKGPGLYRFLEGKDEPILLGTLEGGGEHGPHAVIPSPDGRLIVLIGNHTHAKVAFAEDSPFRVVMEGHPIPRVEDPRGHAHGIRAPGGIVMSVNPDGSDWRLIAGGLRNAYDGAFNDVGELFVYDSDMEWDVGLPWYRPTRLYHVVPGADFGWRSGSAKWPSWRHDAMPPAIEVGRGSPTGVVRYDGKKFPSRFFGMLLGADWAQGRILAFPLRQVGQTYSGDVEVLVRGRPLNVTDLVVDGRGDVLFSTGGRGTRGAIYRLEWTGEKPTDDAYPPSATRYTPPATENAWLAAVSAEDSTERYRAARHLETADFQETILNIDLTGKGDALVALARAAVLHKKDEVGVRLARFVQEQAHSTLTNRTDTSVRLAGFRALGLLATELGLSPSRDVAESIGAQFPTGDPQLDYELALLLVRLLPERAPELLTTQLEKATTRNEQLHLASCLHACERGWTQKARRTFASWLASSKRFAGGASFQGYLEVYRTRHERRLDAEDRAALAVMTEPSSVRPETATDTVRKARATRDRSRVLAYLQNARGADYRSLEEGARVFQESCAQCHRKGTVGGSRGPDLTTAFGRFSEADLLTAVMEPSRHISDQYGTVDIFTKDDHLVSGMPVEEDGTKIVVLTAEGVEVTVAKSDVDQKRPSKTSAMPEGLLDTRSPIEIADLVAFLLCDDDDVKPKSRWELLFDGKTLDRFEGEPGLWSVVAGEIRGLAEGLDHNTFLTSKESFSDFRIEYELKIAAGNSGLQFRSRAIAPFRLAGYQADAGETWWGSLYEERGRGVLAKAPDDLWQPDFVDQGWNHFLVEARGTALRIELNGLPTVILDDDDAKEGVFGFQLHAGRRTEIAVRNLRLTRLDR